MGLKKRYKQYNYFVFIFLGFLILYTVFLGREYVTNILLAIIAYSIINLNQEVYMW